ncbi:DegQ family serine endoprotease [Desulfotalea psychrophila]|uniref:Probable periplasmic serine endoprotease DegP-like n=1 Tax=Desulfotalea psychrophila (strain LSv54 / DSM 12343) TaxID=177439 RepID=Q6AQ89_DESPS|nr:DegQ family serine endoprotease [Desulfotalea psychrophila]CAG35484.1 probable serine protease DegQ [Precursor] [Desulfotalea psychrophila LSv54]
MNSWSPALTRGICLHLLCSFFFVTSLAYASENDLEILEKSSKAFASVARQAKPAVVNIRVEKTIKGGQMDGWQIPDEMLEHPFFKQFFGPQLRKRQNVPPRLQQGQGSGFIVSDDGYILTNNHVVDGADSITVRLNDDSSYQAKLIGTDPLSDVALIKIESSKKLPSLAMGSSAALEVGEWVIAIGNPFGLSQTVTVGIVSAKGRSQVGLNEYENFIQTDAAINPGNSGGPLLNIRGQVIGINSALFSQTGGYMGIGFAIPIDMVKSIERQLQATGKVSRGWLGVMIQDIDENLAQSFGLKSSSGVLLTGVQPDSPAEKGGLLGGDVIIAIDGSAVKNASALRNRVALVLPGSKVVLQVIRKGKKRDIGVLIGERPVGANGLSIEDHTVLNNNFGLSFEKLTPEIAKKFGYAQKKGVVIREVAPQSPASRAGLKAGMLIEEVNRMAIGQVADIKKALALGKDARHVLLRVGFGQGSRYIALVAK